MSWGMWFATVFVASVFVVSWTALKLYLLESTVSSVKEIIGFYLLSKKKMLAELEEEFGEKGSVGKKSFGSTH